MKIKPFLTSEMEAPDAIVEALRQAGVDTFFGIGGGDIVKLFSPIFDHEDLTFITTREESLSAIMAEVYSRLKGRPAAVLAQAPFMVCNAALGTLEAFYGSTPLVLLTDLTDATPWTHHAPYQASTGDYGTFDARKALSSYTKQTWVAYDPAQAVQVTQLAVKHAMAGQPGPTAVLFHSQALKGKVGPDSIPKLYHSGNYLVEDKRGARADIIQRVAVEISGASRPVILAGGGIRIGGAMEKLRAFAEKFDIPVATTSAGKSVLAEDHPLSLGMIGNFGLDGANAEVGQSDCIICLGTKLNSTDTVSQDSELFDPSRQTIIQVDIESRNAAWTLPVDHVVMGDVSVVLDQLEKEIPAGITWSAGSGSSRVEKAHDEFGGYDTDASFSDALPMMPQRLVKDLSILLPKDAIVTLDAGENRLFFNHHYRTRSVHGILQAASIGGMGYAIPAAMGAKLAEPNRPAVAFCGDGGFAMGMNGLITAVEENIPIICIVMNNSLYGWVRHLQGNRPVGTELGTFDHAAIGRAMGCDGYKVSTPEQLKTAISGAISSKKPTVIDVTTSPDSTWQDAISKLLKKAIG